MPLPDKYINPFTDFGFKKLFGSEPNKDLLIDFLNQVLPEKHRVQELSYSPNEQLGNTDIDRKAIFDIYCIGTNGERFIVEMQKAKQNYFKERSVYYSSFPIQEQGWKGGWNFQLAAVYLIGILDFVFSEDEESQEVRHEIQLRDTHCRVFYEKLTYIYLEMPNFHKTETELETNFDKWMYVLQQLPNLQKRPRALQERVFKKLFDTAEIARFTPDDRSSYERSLKYYRDLKNVVDTSYEEGKAEGREEGIAEGKAEGLAEGMEKGLAEGMEKGLAEGMEKGRWGIALQMKQEGESLDKISRLTGLSREDIEKL